MQVVYLLIAFFSTLSGAIAGIGGGVIIKPVLDVIGFDSLPTISVLSTATVFSMAAVSTLKQIHAGFRPDRRMLLLSAGAAGGGILGSILFDAVSAVMEHALLKSVQAAILAILLTLVLLRKKLPELNVKGGVLSAFIGVILGIIAAFLGIGGGPVNVAVLCMFLSMSVKDAAVVSIIIILFSQGAKLAAVQAGAGILTYPGIEHLLFMIPGGVAGGFIGAKLNRTLSHIFIERFYFIIIFILIALNIVITVWSASAG